MWRISTLTLQVVFSAQTTSCSAALCNIEKTCFFPVFLSVALLLCCYEYDVLSLEQLFQQVLNLYLSVTLQKTLRVFYLCTHNKCLRFYCSLPLELFHMVESQSSMEQKKHWHLCKLLQSAFAEYRFSVFFCGRIMWCFRWNAEEFYIG